MIHFDYEFDGKRYKENFLWNIDEPYLTPESYAKIVAEENSLPL